MGLYPCYSCSRNHRARYAQNGQYVCEHCVILHSQWASTCLECHRVYPLIDGVEYPGCACYDLDHRDQSFYEDTTDINDGSVVQLPKTASLSIGDTITPIA
jgi:predicted ATP-dependent serine protease